MQWFKKDVEAKKCIIIKKIDQIAHLIMTFNWQWKQVLKLPLICVQLSMAKYVCTRTFIFLVNLHVFLHLVPGRLDLTMQQTPDCRTVTDTHIYVQKDNSTLPSVHGEPVFLPLHLLLSLSSLKGMKEHEWDPQHITLA